jgi:hypothetical protein
MESATTSLLAAANAAECAAACKQLRDLSELTLECEEVAVADAQPAAAALVGALGKHLGDAGASAEIALTIKAYAVYDNGAAAAISHGALGPLSTMLLLHAGADLAACREACGALALLARNGGGKGRERAWIKCVEAGVAPAVIGALSAHVADAALCEAACDYIMATGECSRDTCV